ELLLVRGSLRVRKADRAAAIDEAGVDREASAVEDFGVAGDLDVRADVFDQPPAEHDRRFLEGLTGGDDDGGVLDGERRGRLRGAHEDKSGENGPAHRSSPCITAWTPL